VSPVIQNDMRLARLEADSKDAVTPQLNSNETCEGLGLQFRHAKGMEPVTGVTTCDYQGADEE
jgi:hypothetical protein